MRFRLRTLLIVVAVAPAITWVTTAGLAELLERSGSHAYKPASEPQSAKPAAAKTAKTKNPDL